MPSPFPGIDPYIEAQLFWPDFHMTFLLRLRSAILSNLPGDYDARAEEKLVMIQVDKEDQARLFGPDVTIIWRENPASSVRPSSVRRVVEPDPVLLLEPVEIPLPILTQETWRWLEIRRRPGRELVTVIELLSPSKKKGDGRDAYLAKRPSLLAETINLVELDLLLGGRRLPLGAPLPRGDFHVLVSRAAKRPICDVFAWGRRDLLPKIPIPLKSPDADLIVDLSTIYTACYEDAEFQRSIDYGLSLEGWNAKDNDWAAEFTRSG